MIITIYDEVPLDKPVCISYSITPQVRTIEIYDLSGKLLKIVKRIML